MDGSRQGERLAEFDAARAAYLAAFAQVPDGALSYRPEGEDYALSGLVEHVAYVLDHYADVLDQIVAANFGEVHVTDGSQDDDSPYAQRVRVGIGPAERQESVKKVGISHDRLRAGLAALSPEQFEQVVQVYYNGPDGHYPTKPDDILTWVIDHYHEHVTQTGDLIAAWRASEG